MNQTDISAPELQRRIRLIETTLGHTGMEQLAQCARQCGLDGAKSAVDASVRRFAKEFVLGDSPNPNQLMEHLQTYIRHHGNQVMDYGMPGPGSF